jgi:hypothetical protein
MESQSAVVVHQQFAMIRWFATLSARRFGSPSSLRMSPVDAFKHIAELSG